MKAQIFTSLVISASAGSPSLRSSTQGASPARSLELSNASCNALNFLFNEPTLTTAWNDCTKARSAARTKEWGKDIQTVAGAVWEAQHHCWCEKKVQVGYEKLGCCLHSTYEDYCQAGCTPDCKTAEAEKCVKECPASCLEHDYETSACDTKCKGCQKYYQCIADNSVTKTLAGHTDHAHICDDPGLDKSTQWEAWKKCYKEVTEGSYSTFTHWQRRNARDYCFRKTDIKAAVTSHGCCKANWASEVCDSKWVDNNTAIDCASTEATECATTCSTKCGAIYTSKMTDDCKTTCVDTTGKCSKYSVCKPKTGYDFGYVCDDGKKPSANGCCAKQVLFLTMQTCPATCAKGYEHYPKETILGYIVSHASQCECQGCSGTTGANAPAAGGTCTDPDPSTAGSANYICPKGYQDKITNVTSQPCTDNATCNKNCCDLMPNTPAAGGTCADPDPNTEGTTGYKCPSGYSAKKDVGTQVCTKVDDCNKNCCDKNTLENGVFHVTTWTSDGKGNTKTTHTSKDADGTTKTVSHTKAANGTETKTTKTSAGGETTTGTKSGTTDTSATAGNTINLNTNTNNENSRHRDDHKEGKEEDNNHLTPTIIIGASVIVVFLLAVIGLLGFCLMSLRKGNAPASLGSQGNPTVLESMDSTVVMGKPVTEGNQDVENGKKVAP